MYKSVYAWYIQSPDKTISEGRVYDNHVGNNWYKLLMSSYKTEYCVAPTLSYHIIGLTSNKQLVPKLFALIP